MCLAGYVVLMCIQYYIETYKEKGAFFEGKAHDIAKFKDWQKIKLYSEVVIADDNLSADYQLTIEAQGTQGKVTD